MYYGNNIDILNYCIEQNNLFFDQINIFLNEDSILNEINLKEIGKNIWETILRIFRKLKTMIVNLISNLNMFREAKIDETKSKDLFTILDLLDLKAVNQGSKLIAENFKKMYKSAGSDVANDWKFSEKDINSSSKSVPGTSGSFDFEATKYVKDIKDAMDSVNESKEYKRLQENKYENNNIKQFPLSSINNDMKNCRNILLDYINELESFSKFVQKIKEENVNKVGHKIVMFLKKIIEYYNFRIKILTNFFKGAKVSLKAFKNNKDELSKGEYGGAKFDKSNNIKQHIEKFSPEEIKKIQEYVSLLKEYNQNKEFNNYTKIFKEITSLLKINSNDTFAILSIRKDSIVYNSVKNNAKQIPTGIRKFYHHTYATYNNESLRDTILKEGLKANAVGSGGSIFYPEPRVYFHLSVPQNSASSRILQNVKVSYFDPGKKIKGDVFELTGGPYTVYNDPEYGNGTACFIISNKNIPVKLVDMDKWEKDNELKE